MLATPQLEKALAELAGQPFQGVLYRAIHLEALYGFHQAEPYPQPLPLYSEGARRSGARYTPRNGMATLYMAENAGTAFAEANRLGHNLDLSQPPTEVPHRPTVLVSANVRLESLLDISLTPVQQALGTDASELLRSWRGARRGVVSATQRLGLAVYSCGRFQAIRYPAALVPGDCCIAIFPDRIVSPAFVEVFDPDGNINQRLP